MAKEVIIEISWLRPLKLIGLANLLCGIIAFILSMSLEDWAESDESKDFQFYMSLWKQCSIVPPENGPTVAPKDHDEHEWNCKAAADRGAYVSVVQALIVIPFIIAVICFVIGCIAYCKREWRILYKLAAIALIIGAVCVLVAVILFPIMFLQDLPFHAFFWFWWGYGIAWAAFCFILTAAILFLISQDKKEIYHTQKKMNI